MSQTNKSRGKIATPAPLAPTASHNFAAPAASGVSTQDSQANHKNVLAGGLARGAVFSALALAIAPLILTAPAHAADDNTVSIAVDQNAALQPAGNLYKATTNVTVKTGKPYGFNLTMQADTADLINAKDSSIRIKRTTQSTSGLAQNTWGYYDHTYTDAHAHAHKECRPGGCSGGGGAIACFPTICSMKMFWTGVPTIGEPAAVIADEGPDKTGVVRGKSKEYKEEVIFAANIKPATLPQGTYSTNITYTATAKPKPAPTVDPTTCKSGDPKNDCQVDLDPNMIPVKYTGTTTNAQWTSIANPEDSSNQGNWYNYNQKQWANAVTVKKEALAKYQGQDKVVDQADILGFWVYIPRYTYEVMRRDGTDKPVSAQNFLISFEKVTTPKRHPAACPEKGKDYRTQCDLDRSYIKGQPSNQGTWATHPDFTFGSKELNGIWFAKFETTGTNTQPTVLPNERHMSGYDTASYSIGRMYTTAKTLGVADDNNIGGNTDYTVPTQNNHHLAKLSSHMVNNNDWGAATYLSASKYGAGYNGVQKNANGAGHSNDNNNNNNNSYGTTGCGPQANGNTSKYENSGTLGAPQACGNPDRAYNGTLGQLASTTSNPTGIYDMSGGGWEYVAASYSDNLYNSNTKNFGLAAHPPYANTYNFKKFNSCTYQTCGGQALYETHNGSNSTGYNMWLNQYAYFVEQDSDSLPWFYRGGSYSGDSSAVLVYTGGLDGSANSDSAFRVALAPVSQD